MAVIPRRGRMSSVLVPCLIKVIHLQGHIPYVLCVAAPAFSGNVNSKQQKKPLLMTRITEKRLFATQRGHAIRENALCKDKQKFSSSPLDAYSYKASWKAGAVWGSTREGGSSCYRVINVRQNAERARRLM